jgi:hypothetical protein
MKRPIVTLVSRVAKGAAVLATLAAAAATAQTNPEENFPVQLGPSSVVRMHYADNLCRSTKPIFTTMHVERSASTTVGGHVVAEIYTIYEPDVTVPATAYAQIPLKPGDRFKLYACGCVQTGGKGQTWKSYFDPKGDNADRYYSGTVGILYSDRPPPAGWWKNPTGMTRIKAFVAGQGPGLDVPAGRTTTLVLGYQDDQFGDNGYDAHDDGNPSQCNGIGPAAVDVMIYHPAHKLPAGAVSTYHPH